tara:strand:- start:395 stop:622 length:228 start_codon:yes stop_codon:yes gene_type:complete
MNVAKVINGVILEHGVGTDNDIVYSEQDGMSIVPLPDWALALRMENMSTGSARQILKWNYDTRQFKTLDLGSFVA